MASTAITRNIKVTPALEKVIGSGAMTRAQAVKNIWAYIKQHNLQDTKSKTTINCDAVMKEVTGKDTFKQTEIFGILAQNTEKDSKMQ